MTCYDWIIKIVKAYVTNKDIPDKLERIEDKKYNNVADNSRDRSRLLIHQNDYNVYY